jgi:hypothetical protein
MLGTALAIVATPTSTSINESSAAGLSARCPGVRPVWSLPRTSIWRKNGWGSARNLALSHRLAADETYLRSQRIDMVGWGPSSVTNKITIQLLHYSRRAARILYARYGCGITVSRISESTLPVLYAQPARVAAHEASS